MKTIKQNLKMSAVLLLVVLAAVAVNGYAHNHTSEIKVTNIADLQNYTDTYIKGEVVKILDEDEFRLKDESGKIKVYTGWKNTNIVKKGETVTVRGTLDPGIINEFYAKEIIRENAEHIKLNLTE